MGLSATLLRDVPFSALYWFTYETIKQSFIGYSNTFSFNLAAGAAAGSVSLKKKHFFNKIHFKRQFMM